MGFGGIYANKVYNVVSVTECKQFVDSKCQKGKHKGFHEISTALH